MTLLAFTEPDGQAYCTACMPYEKACEIADVGEPLGEIYPWTLDMEFDSPDLVCKTCGKVLATAPTYQADNGV